MTKYPMTNPDVKSFLPAEIQGSLGIGYFVIRRYTPRVNSQPPRVTAARIVRAWLKSGDYPSLALARIRRHHGFILEVVQGTMRWLRALAFYRDQLVQRRPRPGIDALLLTALYQLFYMDPGDEHAVVHETVNAAKREGGEGPGRLCNGVLRNAIRRRDALMKALAGQPFAVRTSHPDVLIQRWAQRHSPKQVQALCDWNNRRPDVILRLRAGASMDTEELDLRPHPHAPETFRILPRGVRIQDVPGYAEGTFTVQDPATAMAPELLDVHPGQQVLDLCAAPGGKTAILAEAAGDGGRVVACDISEGRLHRLRENLGRLGQSNVQVTRADATDDVSLGRALGDARFDRILLDVPCSNTGVLQRRPDARWRFDPVGLADLRVLQQALLDAAAPWLRPGGRMVYSTCSLEPEENGDQVREWLARHPGWRLDAETESTPITAGIDGAYAVRLAPGG